MQIIRLPSGAFEFDPLQPLAPAGGFGQVFVGKTPVGAEVAVKRLHLTAAELAHRELEIARELQGVKFQHVLEVIDAGEDSESGGYFVIMPRAERSLRNELVQKKQLEVSEAAAVLLQIVSGLMEIPGIVHRDLKPENILWHDGLWKIADFGIARFVEDATSARTLKGCLSPLYAAPEQWRFERAVGATDIYALGCIAYELLVGTPPFTSDLEKQHQTEPLPAFACQDSRLRALISQMARKGIAARPSVQRVQTALQTIVAGPPVIENGPLASLAAAGAAVAATQHREDAAKQAAERAQRERKQLSSEAQETLADNINRLWEKIQRNVPAAQRMIEQRFPRYRIQISLGNARLEIGRVGCDTIANNEFKNSRWDVVTGSTVTVVNANRPYQWEVSLWYAKLPANSDYRWYEVGYFETFTGRDSPVSSNGFQNADFAASNIMHTLSIAWGPRPIDAEDENSFHERCLWLFGMAANGQLRRPRVCPITAWPPQM